MEEARKIMSEFEDARLANRTEWESYSEELKAGIAQFNEMITAHTLSKDSLLKANDALEEQQKLYNKKYDDFNAETNGVLNKEDIIKRIKEEQERLDKRRAEVVVK